MRIFLNRQMLAFFRILHLKQIFTAECVLDLCGNIGVDLQIVNSANNGRSEYENADTHGCFLFIFKYKSEHYSSLQFQHTKMPSEMWRKHSDGI